MTNTGFVRPIDRMLVDRLPKHAAISLMFEPWEFRPGEIDLEACARNHVVVVGTNEHDPRLRIFDYVGVVAAKLLLESGLEIFRSRVLVLGSDPFGEEIEKKLLALGAEVHRVAMPGSDRDLDASAGQLVEHADALVLAEHRDGRELVGNAGGIRPRRFLAGGCRLVHIAGNVDTGANVTKHPARDVSPGFMAATTEYVGPRPAIELHAAGLHVGALAVRCRQAGGSMADAVAAAEASGLGLGLQRA